MTDRREIERVSALCEMQKADYLRRSSIKFLECAIHLMATHMTMEEVAALLEEQAAIVREMGA